MQKHSFHFFPQSTATDGLSYSRLKAILKGYGEYPAKYRLVNMYFLKIKIKGMPFLTDNYI